jgi:deazaflavin-dependent oxidoreductase (nitroreductase family)
MRQIREPEPPRGWRRRLYRAPVWLYRLGLGWLLGRRFLLLEHTGRRTGAPRETVLEVMRYEPATRRLVVSSGWGGRTQWYRNVLADSRVRVRLGAQRWPATARPLGREDAEREIAGYAARHPRALKAVARVLGYELEDTEEDVPALANVVRLLELVPRDGAPP